MSKSLQKAENNDALNRIVRFMSEGDIVLTPAEETILSRWMFVHKLILQRKFTEQQIVDKVSDACHVSSYTARNDIYKAQAAFGLIIRSNKKYLMHHHADDIMLMIERAKNDKSLIYLLPKLYDSYTKAVLAMPDEINKDTLPPPIMNFFVIAGQQVQQIKSYEDAIASMKKKHNHEYINPQPSDGNDSAGPAST